jgi:hypothetical protein
MRRRVTFTVILLGGSLVLLLIAMSVPPTEPSYKGKPLHKWCEQLDGYSGDPKRLAEAKEAFDHMGTNALPFLLSELRAHDSNAKKYVRAAVQKIRKNAPIRSDFLYRFLLLDDSLRRYYAAAGLRALGPLAKPAIPVFTELLNGPEAQMGVLLLKSDGVDGHGRLTLLPEVLPSLLQAATNQDSRVRVEAVNALGLAQTNPAVTVPAILRALKDKDVTVRGVAARALGGVYIKEAPTIIPVLIENMEDTNPWVRTAYAWILGQYREKAKPALPKLQKFLEDPDPAVRIETTNALKRISPGFLVH